MPVLTTYPGVYIEEIPSGVHTITGVATSITAFVGRAARGPVNEPTTITSFADYGRVFGGLWQPSAMSFAVRDFFDNGGSQAIIVRVFNANAPAAQAPLVAADAGAQKLIAALAPVFAAPTAGVVAAAAQAAAAGAKSPATQAAVQQAQQAAQAPGATTQNVLDALGKALDASAQAAKAVAAAAATAVGAKNATPSTVAQAGRAAANQTPSAAADATAKAGEDAAAAAGATSQTVADAIAKASANADPELTAVSGAANLAANPTAKSIADAVAASLGPNPTPGASAVAQAAKDAFAKQNATPKDVTDAVNSAFAGPVPGPAQAPKPATPKAQITLGKLALEAAGEGAWGANLRARVDPLSAVKGLSPEQVKNITDSLGVGIGDVFTLSVHENVHDNAGGTTEQFANVTMVDSIRRVDKILQGSTLVRVSGILPAGPVAPPPPSHGTFPTKDPWDDSNSTGASGGSDGGPLTQNDIADPGEINGFYALAKADLFNILVIPPPVPDDDAGYRNIVGLAAQYCELRRAFMIVDPPFAWTSINIVTKAAQDNPPVAGTPSNHAAVYFPMLLKSNPLAKNQIESFPPSGSVAGIYARTDAQRGVWKAPAGLEATLTATPGLAVGMNDLENGELNQLGVNCLRVKAAVGPVVWGARTAAGDDRLASEWKYIPVRRTALFLEESLFRGTQWVVFEPNDEPLWSQIRLNVGAFMQSLFRQGAFQGLTPKDAYFVRCDSTTTTQNDINNGIVNIIVGFAPLKPAEFVVIKIQQIAGQIQT